MKTFNIILRGFLYKENWTPLSSRRRDGSYTIDFTKNYQGYKQLFLKLCDRYNVKIFFSTYDTTPQDIIYNIKKDFYPENVFLSPEKKSSQFTTAIKAIKEINDHSDLTLLIRSDLYITSDFIDFICNYNYIGNNVDPTATMPLYLLNKEKNGKKSIDVLHIISKNIIAKDFLNYISKKGLRNTHYIHQKINSCFMYQNTNSNDNAYKLYKLPNKLYDW